jgi:hypothetical protein
LITNVQYFEDAVGEDRVSAKPLPSIAGRLPTSERNSHGYKEIRDYNYGNFANYNGYPALR